MDYSHSTGDTIYTGLMATPGTNWTQEILMLEKKKKKNYYNSVCVGMYLCVLCCRPHTLVSCLSLPPEFTKISEHSMLKISLILKQCCQAFTVNSTALQLIISFTYGYP